MSSHLLIRNGFVLTQDPVLGDMMGADVLVVDDKIVQIGYGLSASDAEEIDAAGMVVMPGFVDTHRHSWQTSLRGILPSCVMSDYGSMLNTVARRYRPEDVRVSNLAASLEALNAGITTLVDWSHVSITPEHSDAAIAGLQSSGIRAVYAHGTAPGTEWYAHSTLEHPADVRRIRNEYFTSDDQLITMAFGARPPGASTDAVVISDLALARELGLRITMHVVHVGPQLPDFNVAHVAILNRHGLLGPDITYVHGNDLSDHELDLIAATGGTVSISPYVETQIGHGFPATGRLVRHGIRPSFSVDIVANGAGDMFTQMRAANVAHRISEYSPDLVFAPSLDHRDILEFATYQGARACGLEDRIGSLAPGKQADIVLLNLRAINTAPTLDPAGSVVTAADTSNVDSVFVAGRAAKRHGRLTAAADLPGLFSALDESRDYLLEGAPQRPAWLDRA